MIQVGQTIEIMQGNPMIGTTTQNKDQDCTWESTSAAKDDAGISSGIWEVLCERWSNANDINVKTPCINMHEQVNQWPARPERLFLTLF